MRALRVVVVGAGGQLGAAVTCAFEGHEVLPFNRHELDIADARRVRSLARCRPDVIINCAAYNEVDAAEDHPDLAMGINSDAVRLLAGAAETAGAAFVHYSSDFVFDGQAERPYDERDAPHPLSMYGQSKAAGEQSAACVAHHYVLRLASVFGGRAGEGRGGSTTIDRMISRMRAGEEVRAFSDRTVTPSYTHDVASTTRRLVEMAAPVGLYHCVASGATTWSTLAGEIAIMLGSSSNVRATPAAEAPPTRAQRPNNCALSNSKLAALGIVMPTWQDALARHIHSTSAVSTGRRELSV